MAKIEFETKQGGSRTFGNSNLDVCQLAKSLFNPDGSLHGLLAENVTGVSIDGEKMKYSTFVKKYGTDEAKASLTPEARGIYGFRMQIFYIPFQD